MPANRHALDLILPAALSADGVVLAPIPGRGPWSAVGSLRGAMRELRQRGLTPRVSYVFVVAADGRIVPSREDDAVLLVMAYRLRRG